MNISTLYLLFLVFGRVDKEFSWEMGPELGIEPRTLCPLVKGSANELHPLNWNVQLREYQIPSKQIERSRKATLGKVEGITSYVMTVHHGWSVIQRF